VSFVEAFGRAYPFPLDDFQTQAAEALAAGRSVLVCAPTGAGKTVVGEFGVWHALQTGGKAFYTTPLKALSNQKFGDFIARYGAEKVGLLTGDNSINGDAGVVVMTTEVLRNMLYESSRALDNLSVVVLDEVHYLRDPYRGATWEEILIHLPPHVRVVALSATLSNAEEFGAWLRSVRGPTEVVIEERRPVPIEHVYMIGPTLHPMFVRDKDHIKANAALRRLTAHDLRKAGRRSPRPTRGQNRPREQGHRRAYRPDRIEVVQRLDDEGLLPAIVFIFSRAGCEQAVTMCREARLSLNNPEEQERIREFVEMRAGVLDEQDLAVLGYSDWLDGLQRGFGAHHAGLIPVFKETVEELFERSLVKVVFATETLSLGINMPARTVVLERLVKFNGERHELMTPADYTQLTGRAGRRGMDDVGYGITLMQPDLDFDRIASLAEGRSFPLVSSFRPSYNMAVNLLRRFDVAEAERLLNLSFGQFLADKAVVRQQRNIERNEKFIEGYRERASCELGDFEEYWNLARTARSARKQDEDTARSNRVTRVREAFERLKPGQVVIVGRGARAIPAAVLEVRHGRHGEPEPVVLTEERQIRRLAVRDFREPPGVIGQVPLPRGDARAPRIRHEIARSLEELEAHEPELLVKPWKPDPAARALDEQLQAHPVSGCPDRLEHERWAQRVDELRSETEALRRRVRARTETLARTFERVLAVLETFGYVSNGEVTDKGARLATVYNESDLVVAEAIARGVFDGCDEAELAAVVSSMVFETRIGVPMTDMPTEAAHRAFGRLKRTWREIHDAEELHRLELVKEPDPGFVWQLHKWARGEPLEDVLVEGEMSPGDFVRTTKQVWDLLRQLADAANSDEFAKRCRDAARAIYRGVVASSGAL
jgi:ATP-dependent RNA helicase HelY